MALLSKINEGLAAGDWRLYLDLPARIERVTTADVRRVARAYLSPHTRTVGYFKHT